MKEWEIFAPYLLPRVQSVKMKRTNTMPAKLAKLQVFPLSDTNGRRTAWKRSDYFYPEMIPEPDYSESDDDDEDEDEETEEEESEEEDDSEEIVAPTKSAKEPKREEEETRRKSRTSRTELELPKKTAPPEKLKEPSNVKSATKANDDGLIRPKKPSNPYLESSERLKLHKELKFSQKYGKGCITPKSELQVAIEKFTEGKLKRDIAASRKTSLERILEQQAKKIEMHEREGVYERSEWMTRLQLQQHEPWANPMTDEFYRVHARVLNHSSHRNSSHASSESSSSVLSRTSRSDASEDD